jgi:hypothetical protein
MDNDNLLILWICGDKDVAEKMVFMYAINSMKEKFWNEVTLLIWGPSSKLISEDESIKDQIKEMISMGVKVIASRQCADSYGVSTKLSEIGINVYNTGIFLTVWVKAGKKIITV